MSIPYVRKYYGVPAKRGGRVRYMGEVAMGTGGPIEGRITSATAHLHVRPDEPEKWSRLIILHPTWEVDYLNEAGETIDCLVEASWLTTGDPTGGLGLPGAVSLEGSIGGAVGNHRRAAADVFSKELIDLRTGLPFRRDLHPELAAEYEAMDRKREEACLGQ